MSVAVATVSLALGDRLVPDAGALNGEPIPWRSRDFSPANLAALVAAHLGQRTMAQEVEDILRELGAEVNRGGDTLYATAPAGPRWSVGARSRWSMIGSIEPRTGRLVRLEVRYLSGE